MVAETAARSTGGGGGGQKIADTSSLKKRGLPDAAENVKESNTMKLVILTDSFIEVDNNQRLMLDGS